MLAPQNVKGPAKGALRLRLPSGWDSAPAQIPFSFARDGDGETFTFQVSPHAIEARSTKSGRWPITRARRMKKDTGWWVIPVASLSVLSPGDLPGRWRRRENGPGFAWRFCLAPETTCRARSKT